MSRDRIRADQRNTMTELARAKGALKMAGNANGGMGQRDGEPDLPRLAVNKQDAATMIGVSTDFFDEHLAHDIPCVRRGRRRIYPVKHLEAWLEREAERVQWGVRDVA